MNAQQAYEEEGRMTAFVSDEHLWLTQRKKNIPWKYLYIVYNSNSSCLFSKCLLVKNRPKTTLALQQYPEMETYPLFKWGGGGNKDLHLRTETTNLYS